MPHPHVRIPHPVFDVAVPEWFRYVGQMPPGVIFFLVPVLLTLIIPKRYARHWLLATSIAMIWLTWGNGFVLATVSAVILAWGLCRLAAWGGGKGGRSAVFARAVGWIVANGVFFSLFGLPTNKLMINATVLDVTLLCGPAFMLVRVLHMISDLSAGRSLGAITPGRVALFLLYHPSFRLGPVTNFAAMSAQFDNCGRPACRDDFWRGWMRIGIGMTYFVIIEEVFDEWLVEHYREKTFFYITKFFNHAKELSPLNVHVAMISMVFRFVLGFAGYIHLAVGMSLLIGIRLPENFAWPCLATSVQSFWRQWHITMGQWLRDYIYIPLGGKRHRILGLYAVFIYCLMWHAPALNMLVFALLHATALVIEDFWRRSTRRMIDLGGVAGRCTSLITTGRVGAFLGWLWTFYFWCITMMILLNPQHLGWPIIRRLPELPLQILGWVV